MDTSTVIGSILFLSASAILGMIINRATRLDLTLASLLAGLIANISLPILGIDTGITASNIHDIVFFIILPVLVFEAAWHLDPRLLRRWLLPIFLLATVGVVISTAMVAIGVYFGINHAGFPIVAALICGAILAATDPISVVASLKRFDAPSDLATLIEGESLFNDATAVVLFSLIVAVATSGMQSGVAGSLSLFSSVFFGGIVCGAVLGLIGAILALLLGKPNQVIISQIFLAFSSFYIAEHLLHISGIMSVMASAICSRSLLREHQETLLRDTAITWDWLGVFFNAIIFVLMGLIINSEMFIDQWLAIVIAIFATLIARALAVLAIANLTRWQTYTIPLPWQIIMWWGGLRGAISIVLALSLPVELPYWWTIQSMVFGVVLFSLLVQGTSTGLLIKRLKTSDRH